jgi:hypothetical protein
MDLIETRGTISEPNNNKNSSLASNTTIDNIELYTHNRHYEVIRDKCEFAIYVIDNSGSMDYYLDGKTFVMDRDSTVRKTTHLTRWEEAVSKTLQIVKYNINRNMAASYYLLNPASGEWIQDKDYIVIDPNCLDRQEKFQVVEHLKQTLLDKSNIRGDTPLDRITNYFIYNRECFVRKEVEIVCYNIITDGEPNDKLRFEFQLRELCRVHKVWLVVNLCTDDDSVVDYYNSLDTDLGSELAGMDVLDDFESEAKEVWNIGNRFFNYSLDIHICRMAGCYSVVSDWMDEILLEPHYADKLIRELTGITDQRFGYTEFQDSIRSFVTRIDSINARYPAVYSIIKRDFVPVLNKYWLCYLMIRTQWALFVAKYKYLGLAVSISIALLVFLSVEKFEG